MPPFWFAAFLGFVFAQLLFYVEWFWAGKLKIRLSCPVMVISPIFLWVATTVFIFLASDKALFVGMGTWVVLIFSTLLANIIIDLIKKSKE